MSATNKVDTAAEQHAPPIHQVLGDSMSCAYYFCANGLRHSWHRTDRHCCLCGDDLMFPDGDAPRSAQVHAVAVPSLKESQEEAWRRINNEPRVAVEPPVAEQCVWTLDSNEWESGKWDSDCGESFWFEVDGPDENRMRFCCYCSKPLVERIIPHGDQDDDD